ncbi:MAG: 50S ribosome-binding GTPase [Candidatus Nanoarchaeia archaeon]|nr:50S ribosome-binding GTPase [Candidatus Nanoarchaeia archaeon]
MTNRQNFMKGMGKKHDTSMIMRSRQKLVNLTRQRGKYPVLAEKIVYMSDIVLEILDSRFVKETRNPEIEGMIKKQGKILIYVFNKSDLIDRNKMDEEYLSSLNPKAFVSCFKKEGIRNLRDLIKIEANKVESPVDKVFGKVSVGVVGYPNTGKSSVINLLAGRTATGVGRNPGFTKGIIKIRLSPKIMLLDSPGIISEKDYSTSHSYAMSKHTKVGARSYSQVQEPVVAVYNLMREYPSVLEKFYNVESQGDTEIFIEELGKKKNFIVKGGEVDEERTARLVLKDWQEGKIRI